MGKQRLLDGPAISSSVSGREGRCARIPSSKPNPWRSPGSPARASALRNLLAPKRHVFGAEFSAVSLQVLSVCGSAGPSSLSSLSESQIGGRASAARLGTAEARPFGTRETPRTCPLVQQPVRHSTLPRRGFADRQAKAAGALSLLPSQGCMAHAKSPMCSSVPFGSGKALVRKTARGAVGNDRSRTTFLKIITSAGREQTVRREERLYGGICSNFGGATSASQPPRSKGAAP